MKVIAICNQKGGVTKTTTTVNLGVGLSLQDKKVLIIDADPQGDCTTSLGWPDNDNLSVTLATMMEKVLRDEIIDPCEGILHHCEGVDLVPSNMELSGLEVSLVGAMSREFTLKSYLETVKVGYDFALIDCMPSLGMITINALAAADSVIVPVQAQYLPAKGMIQLMKTIAKVKKQINPRLNIDGVLMTLVDNRTNLSRATEDTLRRQYGRHHKSQDQDRSVPRDPKKGTVRPCRRAGSRAGISVRAAGADGKREGISLCVSGEGVSPRIALCGRNTGAGTESSYGAVEDAAP